METYRFEACLDGDWELYIAENQQCAPFAEKITGLDGLLAAGLTAIPGRVPGNFELDMERAGLLPDLFFGENTLLAQNLENRHLWYRRSFRFDAPDGIRQAELTFDGIDTLADIYLNGEKIGSAENMLIGHTFTVTPLVGENELLVHIKPTCIEARKNTIDAGCLSFLPYNAAGVTIRKANHMFGWDIMPRIVSGGIWKSVFLRIPKENRIADIYLCPTEIAPLGCFHLYCRTELAEDDARRYRFRISGSCKNSRFRFERVLFHNELIADIRFENPVLWYPSGMGEAALYDVCAELLLDDKLADSRTFRVGLRTVELENTEVMGEDNSGGFFLIVNGERMYPCGTNWVPLDAFHSRDAERLPQALALLKECNCNMVRIWGGNIYESDALYQFCDENGIAVWQDFCMACSFYPQDDAFAERMRQEALSVVHRLRNHTSLVLWAGDNENDWVIHGAHSGKHFDPNKNRITRSVLPGVLQEADPYRIFLPSSPYYSPLAIQQKNARTTEHHPWGPRGYYKDDFYRNELYGFVSEIGYHGCPSPVSIRKFLPEDHLAPVKNDRMWLVHAACMEPEVGQEFSYRIPLMFSQIAHLFGSEETGGLEEFALCSQIVQAEADKFFIESNRLNKWHGATGIFYWNLIDGWPQFSDAVVDYYGEKKLAFEVIRRCFAPVALMFREPEDGVLTLAGCNDTLSEVSVSYRVENVTDGGTVLSGSALLRANAVTEIGSLPCPIGRQILYRICWEVGETVGENHYLLGNAPLDRHQCISDYRKAGLLKGSCFAEDLSL